VPGARFGLRARLASRASSRPDGWDERGSQRAGADACELPAGTLAGGTAGLSSSVAAARGVAENAVRPSRPERLHRVGRRPTVTGGPRKCTEPVAPLSGLPTDRRRSDRRSESHQPRTLRTRCKQHPRGASESRQGCHEPVCRKLRSFLFAQGGTAVDRMCSRPPRGKKGAGPEGPAHKFAEPGTLSSTFPTNVPLPRSAPRGASSYRRPVLGAGRNLRDRTCRIKTRPREVLAICARRGVDASTGEREAGADPVPTPSDVEHLPLELVHPPAPEGGADDRRR
jgi:hypothetical protein